MDDTLCKFMQRYQEMMQKNPSIRYPQSQYGFFTDLEPIDDAISSMHTLREVYDVWILTRPSYMNPLCYTEKRVWVEKHLGINFCKKLILCPDKSLLKGDYLIDDIKWPGFEGEQILFGSEKYRNWKAVIDYLYWDKYWER